MKRLLPRPPRRGATPSEETAPSTEVQPAEAQAGLPAGAEPEDPAAPPRPSFRTRARLRRRLRYLRRVRELGFRDLGGLVFEEHKFSRRDETLVRGIIMWPGVRHFVRVVLRRVDSAARRASW